MLSWTPEGEVRPWSVRLGYSTCKTSHSTCKTSYSTCQIVLSIKKLVIIMLIYVLFLRSFSGGGCVWGLGGGMGDWVGNGMLGGFNFIKEIPFNEISEKLKILLKKVKGVNFPKEIPLNGNF